MNGISTFFTALGPEYFSSSVFTKDGYFIRFYEHILAIFNGLHYKPYRQEPHYVFIVLSLQL